jgi:hypothetical protein
VKQRLLHEVDTLWYQPGQLQYLMHRIAHRILPPMRNADPGYDTEVHLAVGLENQEFFKDTADHLLKQGGYWVRQFKQETAAIISGVIGEPVSADQITVSEPINNIEAHQLTGAGNRTLPDGRVIHDGGYEIQVSYKAPDRVYYLYKLWLRRSKTEIGVTRRLILPIATFLPREDPETGAPAPQVDQFFDGLFGSVYPCWLAFLNDLEAEEIRGHLEGKFGPGQPETIKTLSGNLDTLLINTPLIRKMKHDKLAVEGKNTYSKTDADNIKEQDAAAKGAMDSLKLLLDPASAVTPPTQVEKPSRDEIAYRMAWDLTRKVFEWKRQRFIRDAGRFTEVLEDLRTFAAGEGAVVPNLVVDKILLSKEAEFLEAARVEEQIELPAGATQGQIFFIGSEVAHAGLWEALKPLKPTAGEQISVVIFARDIRQKIEIEIALERERGRLRLAEPVINVQDEYQGDLQRALEERAAHYRAQDANLQVRQVLTVDDLSNLGAWLRIPDISARALVDRVRKELLQQQL